MPAYLLHGKLTATTGKGSQLSDILLQASHLVSTAKGCRQYVVSHDAADPDTIWITEIWESKEDHDNSLNIPAVRQLISQAIPLLSGQPERGQELDIIGGYGPVH